MRRRRESHHYSNETEGKWVRVLTLGLDFSNMLHTVRPKDRAKSLYLEKNKGKVVPFEACTLGMRYGTEGTLQ